MHQWKGRLIPGRCASHRLAGTRMRRCVLLPQWRFSGGVRLLRSNRRGLVFASHAAFHCVRLLCNHYRGGGTVGLPGGDYRFGRRGRLSRLLFHRAVLQFPRDRLGQLDRTGGLRVCRTGGQPSLRAGAKLADIATRERNNMAHLYELSRTILLLDRHEAPGPQIAALIQQALGTDSVALYDPAAARADGAADPAPELEALAREAWLTDANKDRPDTHTWCRILHWGISNELIFRSGSGPEGAEGKIERAGPEDLNHKNFREGLRAFHTKRSRTTTVDQGMTKKL
jgi:hypothetical protein